MTAMPLADAYGLPVTAASRDAVEAYDRGVDALLGFGADAIERFRDALGHDPDFALARAALAVALYLDEQFAEGRGAMQAAVAAAPALPDRERRHVEALALWVGGRAFDAIGAMRAILADHPRDVVVLQRLYFTYFWQGRSPEMLDLARSVREAYEPASYMLGLLAFSLEENGQFDEGLALAEQAMRLNPKDAWAVHAMAHVHYERGENRRGIEALPPSIHPCDHLGYFKNHLLWHLALLHLAEGEYDRVGRLFQGVFGRLSLTIASDFEDAVALAWRLALFGADDASRWERLAAAARRWLDASPLLFHDVHVAMALSAGGDWPSAERQLERLRQRAKTTRNTTLPDVVVPLVEGLHAHARGDHADAARRLDPIEPRIVEIGGSHAQREIFHDTLLVDVVRAGDPGRADARLGDRLAKRPNPGHYWTTLRPPVGP
jgi:tetratricopeptide (TPR) repeat protein